MRFCVPNCRYHHNLLFGFLFCAVRLCVQHWCIGDSQTRNKPHTTQDTRFLCVQMPAQQTKQNQEQTKKIDEQTKQINELLGYAKKAEIDLENTQIELETISADAEKTTDQLTTQITTIQTIKTCREHNNRKSML